MITLKKTTTTIKTQRMTITTETKITTTSNIKTRFFTNAHIQRNAPNTTSRKNCRLYLHDRKPRGTSIYFQYFKKRIVIDHDLPFGADVDFRKCI